MSDTSDPLEILNAIDRERGESAIGMIQANQVQRLRTEIVALRQARHECERQFQQQVAEVGRLLDQLHKARDEIVALRQLTDGNWVWKQITGTRAEALEEAAHECDEEAKGSGGEVAFRDGCETCAAAIRLLKEARK